MKTIWKIVNRIAGILFIVLNISSCAGSTVIVTIDHYRTPVSPWDGPWMAYRLESSDGEMINWIWGISNFSTYEWGNRYVLKLKKERITNPPLDSPSTKYSLIEILSVEDVGYDTSFTLPLKRLMDVYVLPEDESQGYTLLGDVKLRLKENSVSAELFALLASSSEAEGHFTHDSAGGIILHNFSGEFSKEIAMDSVMRFFPDQEVSKLFEWEKEEFISFFRNNYTRELWF